MLFYAFGMVFIACELGHRASNEFDDIYEVVDAFEWYLFPDELKKIHAIIISSVQRPVNIEFFGNISCSRDTFKGVR